MKIKIIVSISVIVDFRIEVHKHIYITLFIKPRSKD